MGDIDLKLPKKRKFRTKATFIKRTLAFFIDLIIIQFIIISPFKSIFKKIIPFTSLKESMHAVISTELYAISFYIATMIFLYFTFTEFITGRSIGKKILGLYVVSEKDELRLYQIILRNLALLPFFPFIIMWLIDPLTMMFSKTQKRASDMFAKTEVIQVI